MYYRLVLPFHFPLLDLEEGGPSIEPWQTTLARTFHILWTLYLLTCISFHFVMSAITNPNGSLGKGSGLLFEYAEEGGPLESDRADSPSVRRCVKCNDAKAERAHHCSICDRCVLRMDHHCPWIHNW